MAKPVDRNDSTMEVSTSQLVPGAPPPKRRPGPPQNIPQNERSLWARSVVGTDDFAPAQSKSSVTRWLLVVVVVVVLGAGGYLLYRNVFGSSVQAPAAPADLAPAAPADPKPADPPKPAPKPAVVPPDVAPVVTPDAAAIETLVDAATEPAIDAGTAAVAAIPKPVVKRPVVKRPIVKKPVVKKKPVPKRR
jgi:hypothetical protein